MRNHYYKILFPIHLYHVNIRENNVIQREILSSIQECYSDSNLPIPDGWLTDSLITSFDNHDLNEKIFHSNNSIHEIYQKYVRSMFDKNVELSLEDMWFNYYINGEYQESHSHVRRTVDQFPIHYSCIHYLKFDDKQHLPTEFTDPLEDLRVHSMEMDSSYYSPVWSSEVKEGDLLMFPSYLHHHVPKSLPTPNNPRVTIAFNLRVLKYGS